MLASLTDSTIKRHLAKWQNDAKPYELRDTSTRGLCLRVGAITRKWCLHVVIKKKVHRVGLGSWPCIGTEEARRRALDWLYHNREGWNHDRHALSAKHATNPATTPAIVTPAQSEDTQASHSNNETLATTLAQYLTYKKLKPNTSRSYSDALKFHLKAFADKPVSSLTSQNVLQLYNQLLETLKPTTANLQIRVLRALHRFWYASQGKTSPDIFKAISILGTRQKSTVRTRHLSDDQLKQLGQQWHKLSLQEQAFMQLALYTGFRLSELKSLTPASYDPVARALHLSHTKNGKPHTLPVAQSLHTLLAELCQAAPAYLLSRHIHNYASIISRKIGIPFSCHDLRRTFATHATKLGISAYIVKALLNHTNTNDVTERHYIHLHIDDLKMPIETISNHFSNLIHNK